MKKRKLLRSIVAMTALVAMLAENTFSVMAAVNTDSLAGAHDTAIEVETQNSDIDDSEIISKDALLDQDEDIIEETPSKDTGTTPVKEIDINIGEDDEIEDLSAPEASVTAYDDRIEATGMKDVTLYVNTDRMLATDSYELQIRGNGDLEYSGDLKGVLSKDSSGIYHIEGLGLKKTTFKVAGLSAGMTVEYTVRADGDPQIELISKDEPRAVKKLRITDSGFEIKGSGYDSINLKLDAASLPVSANYDLYIKTKANVKCNGDIVDNGVVTSLIAEETSLRLSNLDYNAFTIYIEGKSSDRIFADYTIDSEENGVIAAVVREGDKAVKIVHEDEEDNDEEDEEGTDEEVRNEKREYDYEDGDVYVTAELDDPAAIPDDAEFVVTKITSGSSDYNYDAYMEALNNNADAITGEEDSVISDGDVLLYDVAFYGKDEDGNRIELQPEAGAVRINIRFKKDQLKDELGAETAEDVKTIHLPLVDSVKEDTNTTAEATDITASDIKVEVVADSTSVEGEKVGFTLSDFSAVAVFVNGKMEPGPDETFKTILGNACVHGVVANTLNASGHFETNFATGTLKGGANVATCKNDNGNAGVTYIGEYTGSGFFMDPNGNSSSALVYTTQDALNNMHESMRNRTRNGVVIDTTTYTAQQIKDRVSSLVSKVNDKSEALADVTSYKFSSVVNGKVLDIASKGNGKGTYYVTFEKGEYAANAQNLQIKLAEGQKVVLTIPDENIEFQQMIVNGNAMGGQPGEDPVCQSVVLNCPNAKTAKTIGSVAAIVLVPKADFRCNTVSAGWLVANNVLEFSSEWHCVWHDMPPASECSTTIEALKTVDFATPTKDQKFWFDLYSYDWSTKKLTLIQSVQNNGDKVIFDPFYYREEGTFSYVLKERMENDAFTHDPNEYTIHIKVRKNTQLNQYEIYEKNIYKKNTLTKEDFGLIGHADDSSVIKFNNQKTPKVPFDFSITKLFYQNDGRNWKKMRLIDEDLFKDYGFGKDWPDGASFTFNLERFDGKPTNSGIRMDSPLPPKTTITLTKDNRTDSFGRVYFEADSNWDNYYSWDRNWSDELHSWQLSKVYMYKITEVIPDDAHKIPGVVYTNRPVYVKVFVDTYWEGNSVKVRTRGRASYVNDNSVAGQECFSMSDAELEFINAFYSGTLKIKKDAFDAEGNRVDSDKDFYAVVYRKSGNNKIYYGTDGIEYLFPHAEAVKGNSEVLFKQIPLGYTYYVYESDKDGTQISGSKVYEITYKGVSKDNSLNINLCNMNKEVTITNKRLPGSIKLVKSDTANKIKLAGAVFELYKDGKRYPDTKTTYTTDANGEVFVDKLPWGTYYFKEIKVPEGYVLPAGDAANTKSVTIDETTVSKTLEIDADNKKVEGSFLLHKIDPDRKKLVGAKFMLTTAAGSSVKTSGANGVYKYDKTAGTVQTLETDSNGDLTVEGLPYGEYRVTETVAPKDYNLDPTPRKVVIRADKDVVEFDFENTLIKANVEFIKVDPTDSPIKDVKFTLYKTVNGKDVMQTTATSDSNGHVYVTGLGVGSYYFKEDPVKGFENNDKKYTFTITDNDDGKTVHLSVYDKKVGELEAVVNTPLKGSAELFKYVVKDGVKKGLEGAVFKLFKKEGDKDIQIGNTYTTDSEGFVTVSGLEWGSYYFKEITPPAGFNADDTPISFMISRNTDFSKAVRVELENTPIKGYVQLIKVDANDKKKKLNGVRFELWKGTPAAPVEMIDEFETVNGMIAKDTVGALEYGSYFFKESQDQTVAGYKLNKNAFPFVISQKDALVEIEVENERELGKVVLEKYNKDHSKKLDGAVFNLYKAPAGWVENLAAVFNLNKVGSYVTENGGMITVENLEWGRYYFVETKAPKGYVIGQDNTHSFTIDEDHLIAELTYSYANDSAVVNEEETGAIKLIKDDGQNSLLEGAVFELYKDGVRYPDSEKVYVTDDKGEIFVDNLPWGTYYFVETIAPEGFVQPKEGDAWAKTEEVVIDENNTISSVEFREIHQSNTPIYGSLKLKKVDDKKNALAGAEFSLYRIVDGNEKKVEVSGDAGVYAYSRTAGLLSLQGNLVTNNVEGSENMGILTVTGLPYGTYKVYEEKAPEGYNKLEGCVFEFVITDNEEVKYIEIENTPVLANVEFIKTDINNTKLEGAVFGLWKKVNDEWTEWGQVESGKDGRVERLNLGEGEYKFREIKAAEGHELNEKDYFFSVTPADNGKYVTLDNPDKRTETEAYVFNTPKKGKVRLFKAIAGTNTGLKGAEFDLYRKGEDTPLKSGIESDENGYVIVDELEWGTYYFRETKAPEGYVLDDKTKYEFRIDAKNVSELITVDLKGKELRVDNTPILGQAELIKQDSVTKSPIEGAKFALYYAADNTPVKGYESMTTGKDGVIRTEKKSLKAGSYYFKEIEPAEGYMPNTAKYEFKITQANMNDYVKAGEDGIVYNTPKNGKAELLKYTTDADGNVKGLEGAEFTLYRKESVFVLFTRDNELGKYVTDTNGFISVEGLQWGDYFFKETAAPEGYELNGNEIRFTISATQLDYTGDYRLSHDNTPYKGSVKLIKKYAIGGEVKDVLPGAKFKFYKKNGSENIEIKNESTEDGLYTTDEKGEIVINDLEWGSYFFDEVSAPEGFALPKNTQSKLLSINAKNVFDSTKEPVTDTLINDKIYGNVKLIKINDSEPVSYLAGAQFKLYKENGDPVYVTEDGMTEDGMNYVYSPVATDTVIETPENGTVFVRQLPYGKYYFSETKAPNDYNINPAPINFEITTDQPKDDMPQANVSCVDSVVFANVGFIKADTSLDHPLEGVVFELFKVVDGSDPLSLGTVTSDENGYVGRTGLPVGRYFFTEISVPDDAYEIPADNMYPFEITPADVGKTVTISTNDGAPDGYGESAVVINTPKTGKVKLIKTINGNESDLLKGATFDLYKINKDKTETRMFEKTTGDEGTFLVEDLEWGSYFFVETAAPAGFEFDKDAKYGFEINRKNVNEIQLVYVDNTKKPGSVEIEKVDKDGNGPLDAVVFDLYKDYVDDANRGTLIATLETKNGGKADKGGLVWGDYTLIERKTKEGYVLDGQPHNFRIEAMHLHESFTGVRAIPNSRIKGTVELLKKDADTKKPMEDIQFKLFKKGADKTELIDIYKTNKKGKLTDEEGNEKIGPLYYGDYYFEEITPEGYEPYQGDLSFSIERDGQNVTFGSTEDTVIYNTPKKGTVTLRKEDENGKPLAGAEFTLCAKTTDKPLKLLETLFNDGFYVYGRYVTDEDGMIKVPGLHWDEYYFVETKAPKGHAITAENKDKKYSFEINEKTPSTGVVIPTIKNKKLLGTLELIKKGDDTDRGLEGAEFKLYEVDDAGKSVDVSAIYGATNGIFCTNNEGKIIVPDVDWGTYYFDETKAPEGYEPISETHKVTSKYLTINEDNVNDTGEVSQSATIINKRGYGYVSLKKEFQVLEGKEPVSKLSGIVFMLVNDDTNEPVGTYETDKDGMITAETIGPLTYGNYHFKEVSVPADLSYAVSEMPLKFSITKSNPVSDPINFTFTNSEVRATAGFSKVDPNTGDRIAGVRFIVRRAADDSYVTDVVSGINGEVLVEHLPMGKYYFVEDIDSAAELGYSASKDDIFTFEVTEDCVVKEGEAEKHVPVFRNGTEELKPAEVPNPRLEGSIELIKYGKSVNNKKQLSVKDAEFELYKDGEKYLSAAEVKGFVKGDSIVITGLPWGTYWFKEIKAPEGYVLPADGADRTTEVRIDGTTVSGSLTTPLISQIIDDTIKVYISKREIGGSTELAGASMELYEADDKGEKTGKPIAKWISGTAAKLIEVGDETAGVIQGRTYIIHEDFAPLGYAVAKDIVFKVNEDGSVKTDEGIRVTGSGNGMTVIMEDAPLNVSVSKKDLKTDKELAGAVLRIMDGESIVEEWSSTGTAHTISAVLETNKPYVLMETKAPKGYYTAQPITFFIDEEGTLKISEDKSATAKRETVSTSSGKALRLTMYDRPIQVDISKKRLSGGDKDYVMGAGLALYELGGTTPLYSWISPESGSVSIESGLLEVGKKYKVVETMTPAGYVKADDIEFTVMDYNEFKKTDADGMVTQSIDMYDAVVNVVISKKAITGDDELPAARLQVVDESGKIMADFMSSRKQTLITSIASEEALSEAEKASYENYSVIYGVKLETGKSYTLKEVSAPAGYAIANDVTFTIDQKGVQTPSPVLMKDKPLEIRLSKKDIADSTYLEGAELELYNEAGEKVAAWTSADKPVLLSIRDIGADEAALYSEVIKVLLPAGKYKLHEAKAPKDYAIAPDVEIDINGSDVKSDKGVIREESMYDYKEGTTNIYGDKIWIEPKDSEGNVASDYVYPDIKIDLYRDSKVQGVFDEEPYKSVTLKNGATKFAFGPVDRYKKQGNENYEYTYKIVESETGGFKSSEPKMVKTENGIEAMYQVSVTNTLNQENRTLDGVKTFILKKDKNGNIADDNYDTITIWLLQNGKRVDIDGDGKEDCVTIANGAKETGGKAVFKFYDLPKYDLTTGKEYKYTVEETGNENYGYDIVYRGNECEIFNTPKQNPFYIKGIKTWIDPDGAVRPDVTIQLFRDGKLYKETKLAADNTFSFGPLYENNLGWGNDEGDMKDTADGHKFLYEIKETGAIGYDVTIIGSGSEMVIKDGVAEVKVTNKYKQEYIEKHGKKYWDDGGDSSKRPVAKINLYATDTTGRKDELVDTYEIANTESSYAFGTKGRKQLPKYDANGKEISYRVEEVPIPGYISRQNGDDFVNTPSKVRISKLDATNRKELPGAVLSLTRKGTKTEVERWTSTTIPHYIEGLEIGGEFTLTEISAPKGYALAKPVDFKVAADGAEQKVEMLDDPVIGSVVLTKLDAETREKLSGAVFNLYGSDGRAVRATGTTGDYTFSENGDGTRELTVGSSGELKVDKLPYGAYYFKEVSAPDSYELSSETVSFTIAERNAAVTVSFVNRRRTGSVSLRKTDAETGDLLAGAEFELYSATPRTAGQAAASTIFSDAYYRYGTYTTDSEGRIRVENLPWDDYYFLETKAPDGYEINRDITGDPLVYTFSINSESAGTFEVDLGTITNSKNPPEGGVLGERRPLAEKASGVLGVRSKPKGGVLGTRVGPATGDISAIALWLAVFLACVGTIVWLLVDRRRKRVQ